MRDRIFYRGMVFFGRHGVYPEETRLGQRFEIDVDCWADLRRWSLDDAIDKAVSYADVYEVVRELAEGEPVKLIETLAERIVEALFARFAPLETIRLEIRKPGAPVPGAFDTVGVEITRTRGEVAA